MVCSWSDASPRALGGILGERRARRTMDATTRGLRTALDAALSSPSGQAVAVHHNGSVAGVLRSEEIMRAIEDQRDERFDGRERP